jgi:capsular exopolysaccharide synthesis family protein
MVQRLQNNYAAAAGRVQMLQNALNEQTLEASKVNEDAIEFKGLQQEADTNRTLYYGLLTKLKEASLEAGLNSTNIRIVDPARVPLRPARPNILLNFELALLLGLVGGVAMIFVLEALDMTVRTPDQIEAISGLPTVGIIPVRSLQEEVAQRIGSATRSKALPITAAPRLLPITFLDPQSEISEAYRALRTSLLLSTPGQPPRIILFTSALPQDGKTTTSVNTAVTMAQQGKRVLLIDADMRRPMLAKIFELKSNYGLSNVLSGGAKWKDVIHTSIQPNLFILASGPLPPHPSELLSSAMMESLLKQWREEFDHVIIDSPPVLSATDGVLLSVQVDTTVLVVRAGKTTTPALRRSRDLLLSVNANIGGVVVNAVDLSSPDYYYYYSGYGYKYGQKYGAYSQDKNAPKLNASTLPAETEATEDTATSSTR